MFFLLSDGDQKLRDDRLEAILSLLLHSRCFTSAGNNLRLLNAAARPAVAEIERLAELRFKYQVVL